MLTDPDGMCTLSVASHNMIGSVLSRYGIEQQLGAGGMGVVYRARDTKLDREVALKVLPPGLVGDERARKRFRKEALALSRLNHPNIATVHDFDTVDGVDFIVMELVKGWSLDGARAAVLDEPELTRIAIQLAEGLLAAHSAGVLHQDLKPANLFMTADGRLKILDFGLATLVHQDATATQTEERSTGGTLRYMAPEQFAGNADERTDIYQAGMVLYELATGRHAFTETQPAAVINAVLHSAPPSPRSVRPEISESLDRIITKATDKDPALRYQTTRELLVDLQRLKTSDAVTWASVPAKPLRRVSWWALAAAGAVLLAIIAIAAWRLWPRAPLASGASIAVLPFANESTNRADDFFSDAMSYEIITQLGKISKLRVTSRTSVARYRASQKPIQQIANELGVSRIVEGAVMRAGKRVRVTASLIDPTHDRNIWSETYDRDADDILALQSDIARAVAAEVRVRLLPEEAERLEKAPRVDRRAQEEYLQGIYQQINMPMEPMMAQQHFQRALQIDPNYAAAYAGLADSLVSVGFFVKPMPPMMAFPQIKEFATKAIALDNANASAHVSLGVARLHSEWDWAGAEREFKRAIALNPSWAPAHHWYAHLLLALDRIDESVAESERASQLDPDNVMWGSCVGWHCLYARKYDDAIQHLQNVIAKTPKQFLAYLYLGRAYEATGRMPEAIAAFRNSANFSMQSATVLAALGHAYGRNGQRAEAESILKTLTTRAQTEYVSAYDIAVIHAGLGNKDEAFDWLDKAYLERSAWLAHIKWDERFADLRSDARFTALVRRIGLPV
jgi:serine/threonine protein kinase/Tfp pilus assembly protein PilF